jgi:hypothetical protein
MISLITLKILIFGAKWAKWVFSLLYLALLIYKYKNGEKLPISWANLHLLFLGGVFFWILIVFAGQGLLWSLSPLTSTFAVAPIPEKVSLTGLSILLAPFRALPYMYLVFTVFMKFVAPLIWQLGVIGVIVSVLKYAKKVRPHLFTNEEMHLLVGALFLSGWPGVLVIAPVFFAVFILHSLINSIRKIHYTRFVFSSLFCVFLGLIFPLLSTVFSDILWMFGT